MPCSRPISAGLREQGSSSPPARGAPGQTAMMEPERSGRVAVAVISVFRRPGWKAPHSAMSGFSLHVSPSASGCLAPTLSCCWSEWLCGLFAGGGERREEEYLHNLCRVETMILADRRDFSWSARWKGWALSFRHRLPGPLTWLSSLSSSSFRRFSLSDPPQVPVPSSVTCTHMQCTMEACTCRCAGLYTMGWRNIHT